MFPELLAQTATDCTAGSCLPGWLTLCPYEFPFITLVLGLAVGFIVGRKCSCKNAKKNSFDARRDRPRVTRYNGPVNSNCVEIYVGNLSYDMSEEQMRKEFEKHGKVEMCRVITNRFGKSKGFGFVEMPNRPEAEKAIEALNDKEILGRKLRVNEAKNKSRD